MPIWLTALLAALPAIEALITIIVNAVENGSATSSQLDQLHDLYVSKAHIKAMQLKYEIGAVNG